MKNRIIKNQAQCLICGDVIESKNIHNYVTCSCGNLSVDGGTYYLKRGFKKNDSWSDCSIVETVKEVILDGNTL